MEELLIHLNYSKILLYIAFGIILITYITHFFFKKNKYIKYLPGFILFIFGGLNLFSMEYETTKLTRIDSIFMGIVALGSGIVGMFFALILGVYNKEKKKRDKELKRNKELKKKSSL